MIMIEVPKSRWPTARVALTYIIACGALEESVKCTDKLVCNEEVFSKHQRLQQSAHAEPHFPNSACKVG